MSADDRSRWDARYERAEPPSEIDLGPPPAFATHAHEFPTSGRALDLACGSGRGSVWLARRGLTVVGVDVSPVAVALARDLADRSDVADRCTFAMADLDEGLPPGPLVDVVLCHLFRDRRLDDALRQRLRPGGLLAMVALSEVGAAPGRHRVREGELLADFADFDVVTQGEGDGAAWLLARRPGPPPP